MSIVSLYPTVKLKKAKSNLRRKGFPFYYLDEIIFDRRTKNIKAGEIAVSYTHLTLPTNREV